MRYFALSLVALFGAALAACGGGGKRGGASSQAPPSVDAGAPDLLSSSGNEPTILSFGTNVTSLTQGQSLRFVAVLTHAGGLGQLVGGRLVDETGAIQFGAFVATTQGSYELNLAWSDINQAQAISFSADATASRTFRADFYDVAGAVSSRTTTVTLFCAPGETACTGDCANLDDDLHHCGACGVDTLAIPHGLPFCTDGEPACENWSLHACTEPSGSVECSSRFSLDNCGACGNACPSGWACDRHPDFGCFLEVAEVIAATEWKSCDTICGGKGLSCAEAFSDLYSDGKMTCDNNLATGPVRCICH